MNLHFYYNYYLLEYIYTSLEQACVMCDEFVRELIEEGGGNRRIENQQSSKYNYSAHKLSHGKSTSLISSSSKKSLPHQISQSNLHTIPPSQPKPHNMNQSNINNKTLKYKGNNQLMGSSPSIQYSNQSNSLPSSSSSNGYHSTSTNKSISKNGRTHCEAFSNLLPDFHDSSFHHPISTSDSNYYNNKQLPSSSSKQVKGFARFKKSSNSKHKRSSSYSYSRKKKGNKKGNKGGEKKRKPPTCSYCKNVGHTIRSCSLKNRNG